MNKSNIQALTSLRFFFALAVFLSHLSFLEGSENQSLKYVYQRFFCEGYLGVSFFFILSGFILSYTYFDKFANNSISKKEFMVGRVARIYPLHLLTLVISIPLIVKPALLDPILYLGAFVSNVLLLQSFIPLKHIYFNFNGPSWSISDEFFFYLLTPFLLILFQKNWLRSRSILWIISIAIFLLILISIIPDDHHHWLFYINPFFRIFDFILGILLYLFWKNRNQTNYSSWLQLFAILLFCASLYFYIDIPQGYRFSVYYWPSMLLIIYAFTLKNGIIYKMLDNKILVYLGEISFGFYLFHQLVIRYYNLFSRKMNFNLNEYGAILLMFSITIIVSALSFHFFEKPMNKFIKSKLANKS